MPRNSNGNYSLPSGNPVSAGTLIESLWANTTLADVGQALTESLDRYGRGTMLAAFRVADGTVTAPGVAFGSESSTGLFRSGAGVMGLSVLGVAKATLTASAFTFNTAPTWASDAASANQLTRKSYVDNAIATAGGAFLPLTGGTLTGALIGTTFTGSGSGLTALNASNLSSGTVADARISGAYTGITNLTASGTVSAALGDFSGTSPEPLSLARTGSTINAGIRFATDTGSVFAGNADGLTFAIGGTVDLNSGATWLKVTSEEIRATNAAVFTGNGSGLTALNAANLASGTVPNARVSGAYSGITTLTVTDGVVLPDGMGSSCALRFTGDGNTGIIRSGADIMRLVTGGSSRLEIANAAITALGGAVFTGAGSGLTALDASNLSSGTLPDARLSGAYSNVTKLTLGGDYAAGSIVGAIQANGGTNNTSSISAVRWNNDTSSARVVIGKSRGAVGAFTALQADDYLGILQFAGSDGSAVSSGPSIQARAQETWTGAAYGSSMNFYTVPIGSTAPALALALNADLTASFSGAVSAPSFSGAGGSLTALNASNLSSGTVPNARISGAYSGISTLTLTDQLRLPAGTATDPTLRWLGDTDTGLYSPGVGVVAVSINSVDRLTVAGGLTSVVGALDVTAGISGATFTGSGSGLTALNASNLSSGTVPNARISGAYSGITTLAATSITATSQFLAPDGTTSVPGFAFSADSNTGIYRFAENDLRITCGGLALMSFAIGAITAVSSTDIVMGVSTEPTSTGSVGFRGMPVIARNSTTAFGLSDAGETIRKSNTTAYTWTISPDATTNFPIGTVIFLLHDSTAGNITVARGSGVALVEGTTDANATLTAGERASIHKVAANRWRLYR